MAKFSERYGYTKVSDVLIRETMTDEIQNAIHNSISLLKTAMEDNRFQSVELYIWTYFLNQKRTDFWGELGGYRPVAQPYIDDKNVIWYKKLDLIEFIINYLLNNEYKYRASHFIHYLNSEFERLHFAYRIVDNQIVEITSEEEIKTIETAINNENDSVKHHLQKALELYAKKPTGDYQNSIKESISAVEAFTREITGESTLNFKKLEDKGISLPSTLRQAFEKLYGYTNDKATGIRHALMDDANRPKSEEALFMLVSCSAFINYLTKKKIEV